MNQEFPFSEEATALINAPAEAVFDFLDDHRNLSAHMGRASWMMLGSHMALQVDAAGARRVGSRFGFSGRLLGVRMSVDEVVTRRVTGKLKAWETVNEPRLWVIGRYRMEFQITPQGGSSLLRVVISYALPRSRTGGWLGYLLGKTYARWCTTRMAKDAASHFRHVEADRMLPAR